ncbi:MAG TPA: aldehyde dehydrogenase family protein, partial [Burkholderiaceae bacterium]|nr:aldehyde dehydrogenase family protein [Burkholderiaceae bacterium]
MHSHYLNGQWVTGEGSQLVTTDPATGLQSWTGAAATEAEIDLACKAARAAFANWAATALEERITICERFRDLLKANTETLARLISAEVG